MPKIDETWIANRMLYRSRLTATRMALDPDTGYLQSIRLEGFTAKKKALYIERFKLCSNQTQIAKSIGIDKECVRDALAVDKKFRDDFNKCLEIEGRAKKLNTAIKEITIKEDRAIINELTRNIGKYLTNG